MNGKIKSLSILLCMQFLIGAVYAQNSNILFRTKVITIREVFQEIERQTDYLISYSSKEIDPGRRVTLTAHHLPLEKVLEELSRSSGWRSQIRGHHILIVPEPVKVTSVAMPRESLPSLPQEPPQRRVEEGLINPAQMEEQLRARRTGRAPTELPPIPVLDLFLYEKERLAGFPITPRALPVVSVRSNLLYGLGTLTPNGGIEIGLTPHATGVVSGSYNAWRKNKEKNNKKLWHWTVGAEYRYWLCERMNGHFFGGHLTYGQYNISGKKVPLLLEKDSKDYRYQGMGAAMGVSYGYQFVLSSGWNVELSAGVGVGVLNYDKYKCAACGEKIKEDVTRTFVAPTKSGVSIIYNLK